MPTERRSRLKQLNWPAVALFTFYAVLLALTIIIILTERP